MQAHSKQLELRNAELVSENERLTSENDILKTSDSETTIVSRRGQEAVNPLVVPSPGYTMPGLSQPTESSELTYEPQQKEQGWLRAGGSMDSKASTLVMASKLLLNVLKANRRQMRLPPKKVRTHQFFTVFSQIFIGQNGTKYISISSTYFYYFLQRSRRLWPT